MDNLEEKIVAFGNAAVLLSEAIADAAAEEVISIDYPFEKSFDELVHDILNWRDTVCHYLKEV